MPKIYNLNPKIYHKNKNEIILDYFNLVPMTKIARKWEVSPERIRQIVTENLSRESIAELKKRRSILNEEKSKMCFYDRYHNDEEFRRNIVKKSKEYYYRKKYERQTNKRIHSEDNGKKPSNSFPPRSRKKIQSKNGSRHNRRKLQRQK